jgi:hypothetical protein
MRRVMSSVFISYVSENRAAAEAIRTVLVENGVSVWMDRTELLPGQNWLV